MRWLEAERGLELRRRLRGAAGAGRSTRSRTSGPRSGSTSRSAPRRPYERVLAEPRDARRASGSRAPGSTTPRTCSPASRADRARGPARLRAARARRAHLGRAARAGRRASASALRGARRRAAATASSPTCRTCPRPWSPSSPPPRSARSGRAARPTSAPARVVDRFAQIEPKVLFCVDGYRYNGRDFDRRETSSPGCSRRCRRVEHTVVAPLPRPRAPRSSRASQARSRWAELAPRGDPGEIAFEQVPFDHPLWVLYSSGTTGLPKAIVQGHGGILLEQLKKLTCTSTRRRATASSGSRPPAG